MKVGNKMSIKKNSSLNNELLNETILIALGFTYLGEIPFNGNLEKMYMSKHYQPKSEDRASYFLIEHEKKKNNTVYKFHLQKNRFFKIETFRDLQVIHDLHAENDILSFSNVSKGPDEID